MKRTANNSTRLCWVVSWLNRVQFWPSFVLRSYMDMWLFDRHNFGFIAHPHATNPHRQSDWTGLIEQKQNTHPGIQVPGVARAVAITGTCVLVKVLSSQAACASATARGHFPRSGRAHQLPPGDAHGPGGPPGGLVAAGAPPAPAAARSATRGSDGAELVKEDLAAAASAPPCLVAEGDKSAPLAPSLSKPGGVFLHCTTSSRPFSVI